MPPSSNSRPRRTPSSSRSGASSRSSAGSSRSGDHFDDGRTVDLTAPRRTAPRTAAKSRSSNSSHTDPGAKRRAQKKVRARQNNYLAWTVALAVTVILGGTAAGVWSELQTVKGRVSQKRSTLADLSAQLESGKRRLSALASSSGKERVLVENGYIKPGERLLLFPKTNAHKN